MKIYCRVTDYGLIPMYDSDLDEKKKLRIGDNVLCEVTRPRNYEFLKKFFALVRLTYDNLPERISSMLCVHNEEDMLNCIKIDLGLFSVVYVGGRQVVKLGSISFHSMDSETFEKFYNCCIDLILYKYLRGTKRKDLMDEVIKFK